MRAKIVFGKHFTTPDRIDKYCDIASIDRPMLVTDSQELDSISEHFGKPGEKYKMSAITGALVIVDNGDYAHIWVSWSARPFDVNAFYQHVKLVLY